MMIRMLFVMALITVGSACGQSCKDVSDCKGGQVCEKQQCVDPPKVIEKSEGARKEIEKMQENKRQDERLLEEMKRSQGGSDR